MESKTIELRKDICDLLKSKCSNITYRRASYEASYPYVVYTIKDIGESKELEINIWDKNSDTTQIEDIADNIEKLDKEILTNENHTFSLWKNNDRQWIDDEDKNILRINMTFELRYFEKE